MPREIAETWQWMCPAGVYEIPDDAPESGPVDVIVNYTNCVQCGAITAKGGRLTPPEGGDGPLYTVTKCRRHTSRPGRGATSGPDWLLHARVRQALFLRWASRPLVRWPSVPDRR